MFFVFLYVIAGLDPAIQVTGATVSRNLDHRVSLLRSGPVMTGVGASE
jgi:hypothetical protein